MSKKISADQMANIEEQTTFKLFNVNNDVALRKQINESWSQMRCHHCGKEYNLLNAEFNGAEVLCPNCHREQ